MTQLELLLSDSESRRFIFWLESEAPSAEGIAQQMASMGGVHEMLAKQEREYAAAARLIAARLRRTERMSIG